MSARSAISGSNNDAANPISVEEASHTGTPYLLQTNDMAPSSLKARVVKYLSSRDAKELVSCVGLGLFTYCIGFLFSTPHQRPIPFQLLEDSGVYVLNLVNNEAYQESTVPEWMLGSMVIVCPALQLLAVILGGKPGDMHRTLCVYCLAIPLTELVTWCMKLYCGYLRPNFYDTCQPDDNFEACTSTDEWQDYRTSFPSGHASYAFCAFMLLHLYLERCFGLTSVISWVAYIEHGNNASNIRRVMYQEPSNALRYKIISIFCLAPLAVAVFVACSRVVDNKHFPADIVAGSILGACIARYFHYLWFRHPPLNFQREL